MVSPRHLPLADPKVVGEIWYLSGVVSEVIPQTKIMSLTSMSGSHSECTLRDESTGTGWSG